jgi:hypothetical protein
MSFVQFRVHPSVGCARFGGSDKAYHVACEFPYFLQEQFPSVRFKPKPRTHPRTFFSDNVAASATGTIGTYSIFNTTAAFQNKFKDGTGEVFPQAARFRVFGYVYADDIADNPILVFEVTPDLADITWTVNIANKKAKTAASTADPDPLENKTATAVEFDTAVSTLECKRLRPKPSLPNLAYLFLERNEADKSKVTGRLHVIGNEGEIQGTTALTTLWSDDWSDAAGDGSVEAIVRPKGNGEPLRAKVKAKTLDDLKFLEYGTQLEKPGSAGSVTAMPGWVVVGCPDYVPDMGHFVSLWDIAFSRAQKNIDESVVVMQADKHKQVITKTETNRYKRTDYYVHIHPQLCLFDDVRQVSGEAFGQPEHGFPGPVLDRGHNKHPGTPPPPPDPDDKKTLAATVNHGGVTIAARTKWAVYADPTTLKDPDPKKPIGEWLKIALFNRLRKPGTLYVKPRSFITNEPGMPDNQRVRGMFPRKLGRRMDYDKAAGPGSDKGKRYKFPHYVYHDGNLRKFHGLPEAGKLCGGDNSPPTLSPPSGALSAADLDLLGWLDDMYWPATTADMPMLRELAFTELQYKQFETWQGIPDPHFVAIYPQIVPPSLSFAFAAPGGDHETHFEEMLKTESLFVPALIDMACLGAMLGGSFLPGIEVGREAGIPTNWSMFHGAVEYFPDIRFKPSNLDAAHTLGTLTKDLAVPWSKDFAACDEKFWPTSRPGVTTKDGVTRKTWIIDKGDSQPHLGRAPHDEIEYVKTYWKELGFIRRDASDKFLETEQSWH